MSESTRSKRVQRDARLRWVPIPQMRVPEHAQRDLNQARVDHLAASLDLEQLGTPTVNFRDDWYWIIDGQHRIAALRQYGFDDDSVQCWTYEGLTEDEEAEKFLKLNDTLIVNAFDKFTKGVQAGRAAESTVNSIVLAQDCVVSKEKVPGRIQCVGTLMRVHKRSGDEVLARTLHIIRDAYGDSGFEAPVIDGIGHLCGRYNGLIDAATAVDRLSKAHGGVKGLLNRAEDLRGRTGNAKGQCVAAAAVEILNRGKGRKLPNWWKA